jgi:hypothetical protein
VTTRSLSTRLSKLEAAHAPAPVPVAQIIFAQTQVEANAELERRIAAGEATADDPLIIIVRFVEARDGQPADQDERQRDVGLRKSLESSGQR